MEIENLFKYILSVAINKRLNMEHVVLPDKGLKLITQFIE